MLTRLLPTSLTRSWRLNADWDKRESPGIQPGLGSAEVLFGRAAPRHSKSDSEKGARRSAREQ